MKPLRFILFSLVLIGRLSICAQPLSNYSLTVEEYMNDGISGTTTYRLYVDMLNSDDLLIEIWGNYQDPLALTTTTDFFQSQFGGLSAHEINPLFFAVLPSVQYDSWLTIGISQTPSSANGESEITFLEYAGDNWISEFESGNDLEINSFEGGSWFVTSNSVNGLPDSENQRVLIAQLTTSGNIAGVVNAGVYVNGLESSEVSPRFDFEGTGTFYDSMITFGCVDSLACNYSGDFLVDIENCLYSEEGYDCDGNCLSDYDGDGICNEFEIAGCTFSSACNYNPEATDDDGSCEFYCPGCTDELACNYDGGAIQEDGSCQYPIDIYGLDYVDCDGICITDTDFDGVCDEEETFGCTDEEACNFLPEATQDDGGCLIPNLVACEICIGEEVVLADVDGDGVCDAAEVAGCTDGNACNYDPIATDEDGSCSYPLDICGESYFDCSCACLDDADGDEVCDEEEIAGCQDPIACNYNSEATDPAPCETTSCAGCIYPYACNYDPEAVYSDGSCEFGTCAGCTNPAACNFNPTVFEDDGSCQFLDECGVCGGEGPAAGFYCDGTCIDTDGDTVCDVDEAGCTDETACNYNALVNEDDGSCTYADDCIDCNGECFDLNANQICDCQEILGCLDETACNYDPLANIDSGACLYPEPYLDCNGNCLNDVDADGLCDEEDGCPLDPQNDIDGDGICANEELFGCSDPSACNYTEGATEDDGTCILVEAAVDSAYTQGFNDGMAVGVESIAAEEFCGEGTVWDSGFELCIPSDCFGDFNDDGERGTEDLLQLLAVFGTPCPWGEMPFTCGNPVQYYGYDYTTVQIGDQCWFAENLRSDNYENGDPILGNLSNSDWVAITLGAQAIYDNDDANLVTYGRLYNWYAVDDSRGLCPSGWHVPTDEEWMTLEMELGMSPSEANSVGWRGTNQGTQMKSSPCSWNGTNASGFSALAGGLRHHSYGHFMDEGISGYWWSASPSDTSFAWYRSLDSDDYDVYRGNYARRSGYSVRCVRD